MKTKSLIILGAVLVASVVAVIIKMRSNAETFSSQAAEVGSILLKEVPLENVGSFLINDGKNSVEIASKDGKWVVPRARQFPRQRDGGERTHGHRFQFESAGRRKRRRAS